MSFSDLGLAPELLRAVDAQGYRQATRIQQQSIPPVLAGRDVLASAQTGTGKTAAFLLPVLQRLQAADAGPGKKRQRPRALILTPTRELAIQVTGSAEAYGRFVSIRSAAIYGGVSINPQLAALRKGVDVVVATPGRLLDHLGQGSIDLSGIEVFVLDEADRMLDMGFIRDIRRIGSYLPERRQTLLFSATFSSEIRALAADFLSDPAEIAATPRNSAAERVEQIVFPVEKRRKRELLSHRIGAGNWRQVLVFTRTKHGADRLARQLAQDGLTASAIHGRKTQGARTRALGDFKAGRIRVLVATDIAARGLDIERLPHVVNFDLPEVPEDYVHRIGRTARAGEDGQAISLVCHDEEKLLTAIEKLLGTRLRREIVPGYETEASARPQASPEPASPAPRTGSRRRRKSPRRGGIKAGSGKHRSRAGSS